jgi:cytoskeletal protein CcmA (bactofilin family)
LDWVVRGTSKVVGNAEVGFAQVRGVASVGGDLTAAQVEVAGELQVGGATRVRGPLQLSGVGRFGRDLTVGSLVSSGRLEVAGSVRVEGAAHVKGHTELTGGLDAQSFAFEGSLHVEGTLHAGRVSGVLEGRSRLGPLLAERVDLKRSFPRLPPWKEAGTLHTLRIEAREVHLEGVVVEFLRAEEIYLGPDCRVARYEGSVREQHRSARLGPSSVSRPPPGISR